MQSFFLYSLVLKQEKKKDITGGDNKDECMSINSLRVCLWLEILMNNLVTHQFVSLFTDAAQSDCIDLFEKTKIHMHTNRLFVEHTLT